MLIDETTDSILRDVMEGIDVDDAAALRSLWKEAGGSAK